MHSTAKKAESKKTAVMNAPSTCGGANAEDFAPDELVTAGLGGCTLMSMEMGLFIPAT